MDETRSNLRSEQTQQQALERRDDLGRVERVARRLLLAVRGLERGLGGQPDSTGMGVGFRPACLPARLFAIVLELSFEKSRNFESVLTSSNRPGFPICPAKFGEDVDEKCAV